jgi:hypothetical protein
MGFFEKITFRTRKNGKMVEVNHVKYDRKDGTQDKVTQVKVNGKEKNHTTLHPNGKVNRHGNY